MYIYQPSSCKSKNITWGFPWESIVVPTMSNWVLVLKWIETVFSVTLAICNENPRVISYNKSSKYCLSSFYLLNKRYKYTYIWCYIMFLQQRFHLPAPCTLGNGIRKFHATCNNPLHSFWLLTRSVVVQCSWTGKAIQLFKL